jgi:hypothetical protein
MADAARTVLIDASLSSTFWPHAVRHTVTARNRVPHRGTRGTPSCLLAGVRPTVKYVRVWFHCMRATAVSWGSNRSRAPKRESCWSVWITACTMCCWSEETALPRASSSHSTARFDETRFLAAKGVDADGVNDADESEYSPDSESLGDDGSDDDAVSELSPSVDDNTEGDETSTLEDDASIPDTDKGGDGDDDGVAQESVDEFDSEVGVNDGEEGGAPRVEADSASPEPARRYPHRTRKPPARMMTVETAQYDVPTLQIRCVTWWSPPATILLSKRRRVPRRRSVAGGLRPC